MLYTFAYQMILIIAFLLGGWIGKLITQTMCKLMRYNPKYLEDVSGGNNYPFYYFYRNKIINFLYPHKGLLHLYRPSVPIVYMYGKAKMVQLHGDNWLNYLKENNKC